MAGELSILGPSNLQNELFCLVLEKEFGRPARILEQLPASSSAGGQEPGFLIIDAAGTTPRQALGELKSANLCSCFLVALFNLRRGLGIEPDAIKLGIKGFFYEQDRLAMILKGIRLILGGEIWLSRQILVEALVSGKERKPAQAQGQNGLSPREVQLLVLVSAGASNKEISEKLFISENTVKTHLYNIFRKIKVPNRLQAALWVTKNLKAD